LSIADLETECGKSLFGSSNRQSEIWNPQLLQGEKLDSPNGVRTDEERQENE
jgi:hypothetical protein